MADKKQQKPAPGKDAAAYYRLNTRAVDDLVNADESNSPSVSPQELRKYRRRSFLHIADGIKYFLVKWWFAGVACWFFMIGLADMGIANLDMMLIMGLAVGLLWDLPVNIFIRLKEEKPGANSRYMMFPGKGVGAGVCNVVYGVVLMLLVAQCYAFANRVLAAGGEETGLGAEPILFGIFTAGWDWVFLLIKRLGSSILSDAKKSAAREGRR